MLDAAQYPSTISICGGFATWLGKALAARTACMALAAETEGSAPLETGAV